MSWRDHTLVSIVIAYLMIFPSFTQFDLCPNTQDTNNKGKVKKSQEIRSTSRRNGAVIVVARRVDAQATAGKGSPKKALVGATVSVLISLNPRGTGRDDW